jgi:hypothetical protein
VGIGAVSNTVTGPRAVGLKFLPQAMGHRAAEDKRINTSAFFTTTLF